jgi:hypothetical protein
MHSQVSVNVNIGSPPLWGPSGYSNIDYYLMFRPIMILGPRNLFILSGKLGLIKILRDDTKLLIYTMDTKWFKRLSW